MGSNIFDFRDSLIDNYAAYSSSFTQLNSDDIREFVKVAESSFRPEPLIQINPHYANEGSVSDLVKDGYLHRECERIFPDMELYSHQQEAIFRANANENYVLTTGTGSGKSLSFFIPIIDKVLRARAKGEEKKRTRAIIIYPMNALANSQLDELKKYEQNASGLFSFAIYTGQENQSQRSEVAQNPPDIILTNYMMLELLLTRYEELDRKVISNCTGLEFLVLDELHTYRGRQGADVAMLVRRLRDRLCADKMLCIGTSATMTNIGSKESRKDAVRDVASKIFGSEIKHVITEKLRRVTDEKIGMSEIKSKLGKRIESHNFPANYAEFKEDPLAVWTELTLGINMNDNDIVRAKPLSLSNAAKQLSDYADVDIEVAKKVLKDFLIKSHEIKMPRGRTPFAFKLHQFVSAPGKLYATLEDAGERKITLDAQKYAPGRDDEVRLYPTHFCRNCGHEYHPVWEELNKFSPRDIEDFSAAGEEGKINYGYLTPKKENQEYDGNIENLPDPWIDFTSPPKVKKSYKDYVPTQYHVSPNGEYADKETNDKKFNYWFVPDKFRFCINCGHLSESYGRDINRLASLSGEGRSSSTTMLTLQMLFQLFENGDEGDKNARKLLGFIDNRQDAALQAGHFNDFVFLITFRAALLAAIETEDGSRAGELPNKISSALGVYDDKMKSEFLREPQLTGSGLSSAYEALRFSFGYRMIRDLRRGWRNNNPNLEQLRLLEIDFDGLSKFCSDDKNFENNNTLRRMPSELRKNLSLHILRDLCSNMCINSKWLSQSEFESAQGKSSNYIREAWGIGFEEQFTGAKLFILQNFSRDLKDKSFDLVLGSAKSRFMKTLKKAKFWTDWKEECNRFEKDFIENILEDLFNALRNGGYLVEQKTQKLTGWQVADSQIVWKICGSDDKQGINMFFRNLYKAIVENIKNGKMDIFGFEAKEHTAQVDPAARQNLECRFRFEEKDVVQWKESNPSSPMRRLPVLYCSPTMELGVDISALNFVYMRNVPPTPANYAQRSGRAGRHGQPALVTTYCAAQSPHDQWFFEHSDGMVAGDVNAPTLELANDELLKSHIHAVWLGEVEHELPSGIASLVNLTSEDKSLKDEVLAAIRAPESLMRAREKAHKLMSSVRDSIDNVPAWCDEGYADRIIDRAPDNFLRAFDRWKNILNATEEQKVLADKKNSDYSASMDERNAAKRRYNEALNQIGVLLSEKSTFNSEFYTYRYLAGQNFLPGYNFPRLPLMAWIPERKEKGESTTVLTRSRFLAISEFGPRSLIYHAGRTYRVDRVKLKAAKGQVSGGTNLSTTSMGICGACGCANAPEFDLCGNCGTRLEETDRMSLLYQIETVETKPEERITVNDEERRREGFEILTAFKLTELSNGKVEKASAQIFNTADDELCLNLVYSPSAKIYKINKGLRRRAQRSVIGFWIDPISGKWSKRGLGVTGEENDKIDKTEAEEEKRASQRIVPFVEDFRNILIFTPRGKIFSPEQMATMKSALVRGLERYFQLNSSEIDAVLLPSGGENDPNCILFYEAAEGGAGVLSQILNGGETLRNIVKHSIEIMHYDADSSTLEKLMASNNKPECVAGCYHCLLSYYNQPEHDKIDRRDETVISYLFEVMNHGKFERATEGIDKNESSKQSKTALLGGTIFADIWDDKTRTAIFSSPISQEHQDMLFERGINVVVKGNS